MSQGRHISVVKNWMGQRCCCQSRWTTELLSPEAPAPWMLAKWWVQELSQNNRKRGPVARCSKASRETRSVERKVCFIFNAGNQGGNEGGGHLSKDILTLTDNQWARAFIGRGRGLHSESAQSALTVILTLVMWWSDQHHLDCFEYIVLSTVPGLVCFHLLEASSWNCHSTLAIT